MLIAYDGSPQAKGAIVEAGRELGAGRRAVVLNVREPLDQIAFAGLGRRTTLDPAIADELDAGLIEALQARPR